MEKTVTVHLRLRGMEVGFESLERTDLLWSLEFVEKNPQKHCAVDH